ncbi:MAG: hypothetical protein Q8M40_11590, partial [Legionella sp.]|nr:hypothetical protein [Legionella sp.]
MFYIKMTFFTENQICELTTLKLYSEKYIPYYSIIYAAGFNSEQIVKIAKQGGADAVISLSKLCQEKEKFEDFQRKNIGYEQFVRILSHSGGSKNLKALCDLLTPVVDASGAWQYKGGVLLTPWHQLTQAGFSAADLIGVVSHEGGSKNLQALCALLAPLVDASVAWQYADGVLLTPLHQLMQAGFSTADLIGVLSHNGGSKNLQALCDLLTPVIDASGSPEVLLTRLHQLTQAGFSAADLIGVVSHDGGSKNLHALCDLLVPVVGWQYTGEVLLTPLHQLTQAGFTTADLIGVVSHGGGSNNLHALCSLLAPVVDASGDWQYADGVL